MNQVSISSVILGQRIMEVIELSKELIRDLDDVNKELSSVKYDPVNELMKSFKVAQGSLVSAVTYMKGIYENRHSLNDNDCEEIEKTLKSIMNNITLTRAAIALSQKSIIEDTKKYEYRYINPEYFADKKFSPTRKNLDYVFNILGKEGFRLVQSHPTECVYIFEREITLSEEENSSSIETK